MSMNLEFIAEGLKLQALRDYCHSENRIYHKDRPMSHNAELNDDAVAQR